MNKVAHGMRDRFRRGGAAGAGGGTNARAVAAWGSTGFSHVGAVTMGSGGGTRRGMGLGGTRRGMGLGGTRRGMTFVFVTTRRSSAGHGLATVSRNSSSKNF